jgi:hypothetical protein
VGHLPPQRRFFQITLIGRTTVGTAPLDKRLDSRRHLYLTTHNTHKRQTSKPSAAFEPAIPATELPQRHALDRAAIGTEAVEITELKKKKEFLAKNAWFTLRPFLQTSLPRTSGAVLREKFSSVHDKRTVVKCVLCFILVCGLLQSLLNESSLQYSTP